MKIQNVLEYRSELGSVAAFSRPATDSRKAEHALLNVVQRATTNMYLVRKIATRIFR